MVSVASSSATMDLTAILPALMEGIAQEVGVGINDLKVILVGDETQLDVKPFQILKDQYHQVEWDYKKLDQLHNPEPYVEICLKQDALLLQSYNTSQTQLAFDVKGQNVGHQVIVQLSCISLAHMAHVSARCVPDLFVLIQVIQGVFTSKGAIKMGAVKSFQGGNHISKKVPAQFAQSPLPASSISRLGTLSILLPDRLMHWSSMSVLQGSQALLSMSTLCQHRWNTSVNWSQPIADVDLLKMYGSRQDIKATLQAMGLDHTRLPQACDPGYRHTSPSDEEINQKAHADCTRALMSGEAPPDICSQSSTSQAPPQSSGVSSQTMSASGGTRTTATSVVQQVQTEEGTVYQLPQTPVHCEHRTAILVSRQAARDAYMAMEHNANGYTMGQWYVWYLNLKLVNLSLPRSSRGSSHQKMTL